MHLLFSFFRLFTLLGGRGGSIFQTCLRSLLRLESRGCISSRHGMAAEPSQAAACRGRVVGVGALLIFLGANAGRQFFWSFFYLLVHLVQRRLHLPSSAALHRRMSSTTVLTPTRRHYKRQLPDNRPQTARPQKGGEDLPRMREATGGRGTGGRSRVGEARVHEAATRGGRNRDCVPNLFIS